MTPPRSPTQGALMGRVTRDCLSVPSPPTRRITLFGLVYSMSSVSSSSRSERRFQLYVVKRRWLRVPAECFHCAPARPDLRQPARSPRPLCWRPPRPGDQLWCWTGRNQMSREAMREEVRRQPGKLQRRVSRRPREARSATRAQAPIRPKDGRPEKSGGAPR
jgi:hypothetical protein